MFANCSFHTFHTFHTHIPHIPIQKKKKKKKRKKKKAQQKYIIFWYFDFEDMVDSDKDREEDPDGRQGKAAPQAKRKRRNASHAGSIGFPKDKVVLKRVDMLINLVLNPPVEHQSHHSFDASARRKQTSIGDFTNGREKILRVEGNSSSKEKGPGRQAKPGSGRGRGGRGRGRGRGGGQGVTHSQATTHSQGITHSAAKEDPKQKSRISEYMLSDEGHEEKRYIFLVLVCGLSNVSSSHYLLYVVLSKIWMTPLCLKSHFLPLAI
jgi:hypothetical protein